MRAKIYIVLILVLAFSFTSCEDKRDTDNISRITYYPIITIKGEQWNVVKVGDSFTDPGTVATEGEKEIPVKVGGDVVDTSTPGVYTITYTATNKDGFASTDYRYVGVISPEVVGVDLSGTYKRNAGVGGISTVTKVIDNLYTADNVGGTATPGPASTAYFFHYDLHKIGAPHQIIAGAAFDFEDASVDEGVSYSWTVINGGYGTALRTFVKQ